MNFHNIIAKLMNKFLSLEIKSQKYHIFSIFSITLIKKNWGSMLLDIITLYHTKSWDGQKFILLPFTARRITTVIIYVYTKSSDINWFPRLSSHTLRHVSRSLNPSVVNAVVYHYIRCLIKKEIYFE